MNEDIKPVRVQYSRKHKLVSPNGLPVVYVGRPTKWGNPWKVDNNLKLEDVLVLYETRMNVLIEKKFLDISELRGKNLACWCPLDKPCHADILLRLANSE